MDPLSILLALIVITFLSPVVYRAVTSHTGKRALSIAKANKAKTDADRDNAELKEAFRKLRAAKQEEHMLHINEWDKSYVAALPDSDPIKMMAAKKAQGINVEEARFVVQISDQNTDLSYGQRVTKGQTPLRKAPSHKAAYWGNLIGGTVVKVDGWLHGEAPLNGNNDIWFRVDNASGVYPTSYVWSGSVTNKLTAGLPLVTEESAPITKSASAPRDLNRHLDHLNRQAEQLLLRKKKIGSQKY